MDKIIGFLVLLLFILLFIYLLISNIIGILKSLGYKKVSAKIIDSVLQYSPEWQKYFPDEYQKIQKVQPIADKVSNFIEQQKDETYISVIEYKVNGKTYYYGNKITVNEGDKERKKINKKLVVKYNPQNPNKCVIATENIKIIILSLICLFIFVDIFIILFNS